MSEDDPSNWRSATDPHSGKTYWYHKVTRVSTWERPACFANNETGNTVKTSSGPVTDVGATSSSSGISISNTSAKQQQQQQLQQQQQPKTQSSKEKPKVSVDSVRYDEKDGIVASSSTKTASISNKTAPLNKEASLPRASISASMNTKTIENKAISSSSKSSLSREMVLVNNLLDQNPLVSSRSIKELQRLYFPSSAGRIAHITTMVDNFVEYITSCLEESQVLPAMKCLWCFSLSPKLVSLFSKSGSSMNVLISFLLENNYVESIFYFDFMLSMLLCSECFPIFDEELVNSRIAWHSIFDKRNAMGINPQSFLLFEAKVAYLLDERILSCMTDIGSRGFDLASCCIISTAYVFAQ